MLSPLITPDGSDEDDAFPFWDNGYPAIFAIEDDGAVEDDFNPYYHTCWRPGLQVQHHLFHQLRKGVRGHGCDPGWRRANASHHADGYANCLGDSDADSHRNTHDGDQHPNCLSASDGDSYRHPHALRQRVLPAVNR